MGVPERLIEDQHGQTQEEKIPDSAETDIAKTDEQANEKKSREPTAAQPRKIILDDLPEVRHEFDPEWHQRKLAEIRFEGALQSIARRKHCGFQNGVGRRAKGGATQVKVTHNPRGHQTGEHN